MRSIIYTTTVFIKIIYTATGNFSYSAWTSYVTLQELCKTGLARSLQEEMWCPKISSETMSFLAGTHVTNIDHFNVANKHAWHNAKWLVQLWWSIALKQVMIHYHRADSTSPLSWHFLVSVSLLIQETLLFFGFLFWSVSYCDYHGNLSLIETHQLLLLATATVAKVWSMIKKNAP